MSEVIRSAPGVRGCCDAAGRMIVLAYQARPRAQLVALCEARGEGTREAIEARIDDLLAAGLLIELDEG